MARETPVAQAHIDLIHLSMAQISRNIAELKAIGRIDDEQHQDITAALDNLGEVVGEALHPNRETLEAGSKGKYEGLK
jgi:hypothetical protein